MRLCLADFRLFLTMNPCHGELSPAMRNRGVEIFMSHPFTVSTHQVNATSRSMTHNSLLIGKVHYFFVVGSDCPGLCAVPELKFGQPSGRNDVEVS